MARWIAYAMTVVVALFALPAPASATPGADMYLTFDAVPSGQTGAGPWNRGCFTDRASARAACIRADGDGAIRRTPQRGDPAISFPAPGGGAAILYISHTRQLNPGTHDFVFSSMVDLTDAELTSGANVMQKGLFDSVGGQWKLQVDNGVPSCRVAGERDGKQVSVLVFGPPIIDQGWVPLRCERRGTKLTITVGVNAPVTAPENAAMRIENDVEVTIGGREAVRTDNDQLHGDVDNVYVNIGP